jgi:hypothetical protein
MDLITFQEYKDYKKINSTNIDVQLGSIIPNISQLIKSYCNRDLIDYGDINFPKTEYHNANSSYALLNEFPIIEVETVSVSTDAGTTYTELVANTDYYVDYDNDLIVSLLGAFGAATIPTRSLKVVYAGGYEVTPGDIKQVCFELIDHYLNEKYVQGRQLKGSSSDPAPTQEAKDWPIHIKKILDLYRRI